MADQFILNSHKVFHTLDFRITDSVENFVSLCEQLFSLDSWRLFERCAQKKGDSRDIQEPPKSGWDEQTRKGSFPFGVVTILRFLKTHKTDAPWPPKHLTDL